MSDGSEVLVIRVKRRRPTLGRNAPLNKPERISASDPPQKPSAQPPRFNFDGAQFLDHFETPREAYQDISRALTMISEALGREPSQLRIYDPYYCQGSVKRHLASLGFTNVYNENEDFYQVRSCNIRFPFLMGLFLFQEQALQADTRWSWG